MYSEVALKMVPPDVIGLHRADCCTFPLIGSATCMQTHMSDLMLDRKEPENVNSMLSGCIRDISMPFYVTMTYEGCFILEVLGILKVGI